jgi:flagellar export protein FliJ
MRGLETLVRVRRVAEEQALEELSRAKYAYDQVKVEEAVLRARSAEAQEALRSLERERFGIRRSLIYRRYLNAVRGHIHRCRDRASRAWDQVQVKKRAYEEKRRGREAVDKLLERRAERKRQERERREERALGDLAQNAWARAGGGGDA